MTTSDQGTLLRCLKVFYSYFSGGLYIAKTEYEVVPCEAEHFWSVNADSREYYNLDNYKCIKEGSLEVRGTELSPEYK